MNVLEAHPRTPEGLKDARKAQMRHARTLVRKGLTGKFGIGVIARGGTYWVTLEARK